MINRSHDIQAALRDRSGMRSRQRGFLLHPSRFGASGGGGLDPHFSSVSLLLHMDGANASKSFTDSSPSPKTVTALGTASISTTQSKFGSASASFTGGGTRAVAVSHHADLNLSSGDFTIEFWFYLSALGFFHLVNKDGVDGTSNPSYAVTASTNTGKIGLQLGSGNGLSGLQEFYGDGSGLAINAWHHAAFSRSGSTVYGFLNGALQFATAQTVSMVDGGKPLNIGARYNGTSLQLNGFIDEFRITKGVARYTSAFTPPAAPFPNS